MSILYMWILIYVTTNTAFSKITVKKVVVRTPRLNDIGLIFDLTVINAPCKEREPLEFRIRSDGTCCVNLTERITVKNIGRVVGGNFGQLESGAAEVVSLIWPTVSLYNRVGSCPIIVTSKNARGIEDHQKLRINFDTRFTTLDPECHTLRKRSDYKDCKNWDKEYLKNCTPVNCQERYFGQRSFYNKTTEHCDEVPRCNKPNMIYDTFNNECLIPEKFFTEEDMKRIKRGDYVDEYEHEDKAQEQKMKNDNDDFFANIPFDDEKRSHAEYERKIKEHHAEVKRATDAFDEEFNNYMQSKFVDPDIGRDTKPTTASVETEKSYYMPDWLKGILEGLVVVGAIIFLQVLATLAIYLLICFVIFLIVTWISRRQYKRNAKTTCVLRSPVPSEGAEEPLLTPSSLLSQR